MKLHTLDLTNFRSFRGVSIPLDGPRVVIAGVNGSGKSTCQDAVRWALTGACRGTDARGAGAEVLIPSGQKLAEVVVSIDGIGKVTRTYAEKGGGAFSVENFTGTGSIQQLALFDKLKTTPEFLSAVLDTSVFLDLTHVQAKALVLSLLNVRFPVEGKAITLEELDVRYKTAFEDRKVAKKVLAGCVVPEKPTSPEMPKLEAIDAQLKKLRVAYADLKQQAGAGSGRRAGLQAERRRLEAALALPLAENVAPQIEDLSKKLANLEAELVPAKMEAAPKPGDPERLAFVRHAVGQLQRHEPSKYCVVEAGVPCRTAAKAFRDRLDELKTELKGLDPKPGVVAPEAVESPLTAIRGQLRDLERRHALREADLWEREKTKARLSMVTVELDGMPDTSAAEMDLGVLDGRIARGEELQIAARRHWASLEVYEDAVQRRQFQQAEVERLETLCEQLGPNGIRVQALEDAISRFAAEVNPYLEGFGWTVGFVMDPWTVLANGRPVETFSRSERYRIGIALQLAIAGLSGLNFACIDEIDMLDAVNRAAVTKMLLTAPLEQILILGTREPTQALPKMEGVLAYRLACQEGRSRVVEGSAA